MADLFISYSRRNKDFVRKLYDALANRTDIKVWVDWEGIPPTADWMAEIHSAIQQANTFVFIISPDSIASPVCKLELEHAVKHNKRLIPILHILDPNVPKVLADLNWIYFQDTDDFEASFRKLDEAIHTDLDWVKMHTRLLVKAIEWDAKHKDESFLLRGRDLQDANSWMRDSTNKEPIPAQLHTQYLIASRDAESVRQKRTMGFIAVSLIVAVILAIWAGYQSRVAFAQREIAEQKRMEADQQRNEALVQREEANKQRSLAIERQREAEWERLRADSLRLTAEANSRIAQENSQIAEKRRIEAENQKQRAEMEKAKADSLKGIAEINERIAISQKQKADSLRYLSVARTIAIQSLRLQGDDANLNALLALQAYRMSTEKGGSAMDPDMYNALRSGINRLQNPQYHILRGHTDEVRQVIYDPDGHFLLSCSDDGQIFIWTIADSIGRPQVIKNLNNRPRALALSPDKQLLAAGCVDGQILLIDLRNPDMIRQSFPAHNGMITSLAFSADGKMLISGGYDGYLKGWRKTEGLMPILPSPIQAEHIPLRINSIAINRDGRFLAAACDSGLIHLLDKTTGEVTKIRTLRATRLSSIAFSNNDQYLAVGTTDGAVLVWPIADLSVEPLGFFGHSSGITQVVFSRDSQFLASASFDKTIRIWSMEKPEDRPIVLEGHDYWVWSISFNSDGSKLISGSTDRTIRIWITQPARIAEEICHYVSRNLTKKEWQSYVGQDIDYEKGCPELP